MIGGRVSRDREFRGRETVIEGNEEKEKSALRARARESNSYFLTLIYIYGYKYNYNRAILISRISSFTRPRSARVFARGVQKNTKRELRHAIKNVI